MHWLIDGHNLIPKLGINLRTVDDELELVTRLQTFCRVERQQVEVYFDGAPAGQAGTKAFGQVTAHFVRKPTIADEAIRLRLKKLGRSARNWTVVTSDHRVQAEAHAVGAKVVTSEAFAERVVEAMRAPAPTSTREAGMSAAEVEEWLTLFREKKR